MTEQISIIITIVLSLITFYLGRMMENRNKGVKQGILLTELENIKDSIRELKNKIDKINIEKLKTDLKIMEVEVNNLKQEIKYIKQNLSKKED